MDVEQELLFKYGNDGVTAVHPIVLGFMLVVGLLMLFGPRRLAMLALLSTILFIPGGQRIVVGSLDFTMPRIMILCGTIRMIRFREYRLIRLSCIDKAFIGWVFSSAITYTLLFQAMGALVNRLGFAFEALGVYFIFRSFCRNDRHIDEVISAFALLSALLAIFMLTEQITGRNVFSILGGVPEFTQIRDGRLRCQGPFAHPLGAGAFGATLLPLMVSLWWGSGKKRLGMLGIVAATVIVIVTASSGPVVAYVAGIGGLCMWVFRKHMRAIVWGSIFALIGLHLVMKAPVWALHGRITIFGASTCYHRFIIDDEFIERIDEWWLVGTKFTSDWGFGLWDITNTYIHMGVDGGLMTLVLFILIILLCFRVIGSALVVTENQVRAQRNLWAFGAALFSHSVAFFGMSYFDQMRAVWYIFVAIISTVNCLYGEVDDARLKRPAKDLISN